MTKVTALFGLATAAAFAFSMPAQAVEGRMSGVTACSKQHSSKCQSGPVRTTQLGQQVRLPGGTWVDCAGDCKDKLRQKTVDFWYEQMIRN
jgi:hypothetical protein